MTLLDRLPLSGSYARSSLQTVSGIYATVDHDGVPRPTRRATRSYAPGRARRRGRAAARPGRRSRRRGSRARAGTSSPCRPRSSRPGRLAPVLRASVTAPPQSTRHGASTTSTPSSPTTSSRCRLRQPERASNCPTTSFGNRGSLECHVDPGRADHLHAPDALRLAGEQPSTADAVAADVHQRAAVELGKRAHVGEVVEREPERRFDRAQPARPLPTSTSSATRRVCGWWRYMNASIRTRPVSLGGVERLLGLCGAARVRLLAEHVLAGLERAHRPLVVEAVRKRDVDGVDARRPRAAPRTSRGRAMPCSGAYASAFAPSRLATATTSTRSDAGRPRRISWLMFAVDSRPRCLTRGLLGCRVERAVAR